MALFVDNMRHISEQVVELADALFNVSDLAFSLDNERLLKVDLVLGGEPQLVLLLSLYLLLAATGIVGVARRPGRSRRVKT